LDKIKENEKKKQYLEKMKERELMEKNENKSLKMFIISKKIKKIQKINEYSKEKNSIAV
jgi:hypothetical protein